MITEMRERPRGKDLVVREKFCRVSRVVLEGLGLRVML